MKGFDPGFVQLNDRKGTWKFVCDLEDPPLVTAACGGCQLSQTVRLGLSEEECHDMRLIHARDPQRFPAIAEAFLRNFLQGNFKPQLTRSQRFAQAALR